jgi:S1-C subfamily serine protease
LTTSLVDASPAKPARVLLAAGQLGPEDSQTARDRAIARALSPPFRPPGFEALRRAGVGTGFYIASDRVLTNFHVVDGCKGITVGNNREGAEAVAKMIAGDRGADLAALSTDARVEKPAQIQMAISGPPSIDLAIVGYPERGLPVLEAELDLVSAGEDDLKSESSRYPFIGAVRRGNSGSPVLDLSGAVVGVVTAKVNTPAVYQSTGEVIDNLGFAIPNRTVLKFLRTNRIEFAGATAAENLSPERLLDRAHDFVRQVACWR